MSVPPDIIGLSYDSTRIADPRIVQRMLAHLRPQPGKRYLDLACGTGNDTLEYARAGFSMVGVDQSELMIDRARSRSYAVEWVVADAERLPFPKLFFSGITCTNAIHHFRDLTQVVAECSRVMESGKLVSPVTVFAG